MTDPSLESATEVERLNALLEHAAVAIFLYDPVRGSLAYVNARAEELFGYDRAALLSMDLLALSAPIQGQGRSAPELLEEIHRDVLEGTPRRFEWTYVTSSGEEAPAEVRLARTRLDGRALIVGSVRDLSDLKRAEGDARQREDWLRHTFEYSHDPIFIVDPEKDAIVNTNSAACELLATTGTNS